MYKSLNKPIWTCGLQLWGNAKKIKSKSYSGLSKIQNIVLKKLTNSPHTYQII